MPLLPHIESLIPVSDGLRNRIKISFIKKNIPKGEVVVHEGERCTELYFIEKGLLRGFYFNDGKDITNWFGQENEFATGFYSFISQAPSFETIQAIDDCEVMQISYASLQSVYSAFPETERIGRLITETYYIKLEDRLLGIQFKTAKERYNNLLNANPALLQRASLGHIASYLGITQETLSRIRAEL